MLTHAVNFSADRAITGFTDMKINMEMPSAITHERPAMSAVGNYRKTDGITRQEPHRCKHLSYLHPSASATGNPHYPL
jgi:hypothetical protein